MNYYEAVEKKAEHGGGWAYMQLNRRSGAAIVCGCGDRGDVWDARLHGTAEEAERCFYDHEKANGIRWSVYTNASRCVICNEWTADSLHGVSNLLTADASVCPVHFTSDDEAAAWLWERHPFAPGIKVMASW